MSNRKVYKERICLLRKKLGIPEFKEDDPVLENIVDDGDEKD